MKIKQTLLAIALLIGSGVATLAYAGPVAADCGGVSTSIINCNEDGTGSCRDGSTPNADKKCADGSDAVIAIENTGLWGILLLAINILTAGVGVLAIAGIVYGSILYTSAGGSAEQTKKAIGIITNVVIGILAYALMFGFLNFIIPGGIFN